MKKRALPKYFSVLLSLLAFSLAANAEPEYQRKFNALSPSEKKEFRDSYRKAHQLIQEKRVFDSLNALSKAERLVPNHPSINMLKANGYIELRALDKAEAIYSKLHKENPDDASITFNLGEMNFIQARWANAIKYFNLSLDKLYTSRDSIYYIAKFKLYICHKKLGNIDKVNEYENEYDFTSDSPIYYYINYVKLKIGGDEKGAQQWLAKAARIFRTPGALASWNDTLQESGLLEG